MANIEKTLRHDTLGLINVVWKSNMRSVRMSFKDGRFTISAPVGYTMESIARLIQENESRMHSFIKRHEARRDDTRVDENFILDTHFAIMRISLTDVATSRLKKSKTPVGASPCGCPLKQTLVVALLKQTLPTKTRWCLRCHSTPTSIPLKQNRL